jgi:hypothetical protein
MSRKSILAIVMVIPSSLVAVVRMMSPMVTIVNSQVYDLGAVVVGILERPVHWKQWCNLSIELELQNTPQGGSHPRTYTLTLPEGGAIALTWKQWTEPLESTTTLKHLMMVVPLLTRRYLFWRIYKCSFECRQIKQVAQGDIGQNDLTGVSKVFPLGSVAVPTISGTAVLQRVNGEALAVVKLSNTLLVHPSHSCKHSCARRGELLYL